MWESRRDFQRVWEGWEAGFLAFHAFHTLSFPWSACRPGDAGFTATSTSAMVRPREEVFVEIVVDECFRDFAHAENDDACCQINTACQRDGDFDSSDSDLSRTGKMRAPPPKPVRDCQRSGQ
jgi:hypothetical protein